MNYLYRFVFLLFLLLYTNTTIAQNSVFKVVLDAGHGGKDSGTVGLKSFKKDYESHIALKVTKKVGKLLKSEGDIKIIYTRTSDKFIELHKRGKIANKADADLFISIHCNAAGNKNAYGTTTYVLGMGKTAKNLELSKRENDVILLEDDREKNYSYDPNSQEFIIGLTLMQEDYLDRSIEFAGIVQDKFVRVAKRKSRGVNQGNLAVLYDSYMPSVLIEIGFLTNKSEEKFLHTKAGQNKIAKAIYKAILTYKNRLDDNSIETIADITIAEENDTSTTTNITFNKYYSIQFASSRKKISTKSYNFRGLENVTRKKFGKVYKYYYGKTNDLIQARKIRSKVVKKGYKDAFVVSLKNLTYQIPEPKIEKKTVSSNATPKLSSNTSSSKIFEGIDFKVQISSSLRKINTKAYNFKGLKNIERIKIGRHYKYYYGKTSDFNLIKILHKETLKKGYKGAFIVAIKGGKKVSVTKILRGE